MHQVYSEKDCESIWVLMPGEDIKSIPQPEQGDRAVRVYQMDHIGCVSSAGIDRVERRSPGKKMPYKIERPRWIKDASELYDVNLVLTRTFTRDDRATFAVAIQQGSECPWPVARGTVGYLRDITENHPVEFGGMLLEAYKARRFDDRMRFEYIDQHLDKGEL